MEVKRKNSSYWDQNSRGREGERRTGRGGRGDGVQRGERQGERTRGKEMFCFVFVLVFNAVSSRCLKLKLKKKKTVHTYFEYAKSNIQVMIAFKYIQIIQVVMMSPSLPLMRKKSISSYPSCQNKLEIHINEMLLAGEGESMSPCRAEWPTA